MLNTIAPFFIVDNLNATLGFYQSKLGFEVLYKGGGDGNAEADYYAGVGRDRVMIMLKAIAPDVHPQPNYTRHGWARWDAYIGTDDPDSLYAELVGKEVPIHQELANTRDGLRAFEITDNNGYVICFGRPLDKLLRSPDWADCINLPPALAGRRTIGKRRKEQRFRLTAREFLPVLWQANIRPRSPHTFSRVMETFQESRTRRMNNHGAERRGTWRAAF